jgi:hypothetical protein
MGIVEGALAGGALLGGLGSIMGGMGQQRAGNQAREDALRQQALINRLGQSFMNSGQSNWSQGLEAFLPQLAGRTGTSFTPETVQANTYNPTNAQAAGQAATAGFTPERASSQGYNAMGIDLSQLGSAGGAVGGVQNFLAREAQASLANAPERIASQQIDIGDIFRTTGYNAGNDALMQLLRADPSRQLTATDSQMAEMLATGNPFNTSNQFDSLQKLFGQNTDDAVARIQGSTGRLGARFGSATQQNVARSVERLNTERNAQLASLEQQAFESAQGRRMGAANLLAGLETSRRTDTIDAARAAQQAAGLGLQGAQANQAAALQAALANQATGQQTSLANQAALNEFARANQNAFNQAGMQTQQLNAQASIAGASNATQASIANLQARLGALGQNAGWANQAALFGAQAGNEASMFNATQGNQAAAFLAAAQNAAAQQAAANLQQTNLANAGAANQAGQFNANSLNAMGQFNAGNALAAYNATNQAQNNNISQYLSALGLGNNMMLGQQGINLQALGIMAGVPTPGPNQNAGAGWQGVQGAGQQGTDSMMSWWLMQMMNRGGGIPGQG